MDHFMVSKIRMWEVQGKRIAFVDEVGTGAVFGEFVVGIGVFKPGYSELAVKDSKQLAHKQREALCEKITPFIDEIAYEIVTVEEMNDVQNLRTLEDEAIVRGVLSMKKKPDVVVIDGKFGPNMGRYNIEVYKVIKGDQHIKGISAVSILSKVFRDHRMMTLYGDFDMYAIKENKGYETKTHMDAIQKYGATIHHRTYQARFEKYKKGQL